MQEAVNHRSSGKGRSPAHQKSLVTNGKVPKGIPVKNLEERKKKDHLRGKVEMTDREL